MEFSLVFDLVPNQPALPLGTRVVSNLMNVVVEKSDPKKHELYIDNFFTSHDLLLSLRKENIKTTGTIRDNRTGGATKLMENVASMRKKDRGHFDLGAMAKFTFADGMTIR